MVRILTKTKTSSPFRPFPSRLCAGPRMVCHDLTTPSSKFLQGDNYVKSESLGNARNIGFLRCCGCFSECGANFVIKEKRPQCGYKRVSGRCGSDRGWRRPGARAEPNSLVQRSCLKLRKSKGRHSAVFPSPMLGLLRVAFSRVGSAEQDDRPSHLVGMHRCRNAGISASAPM